MDIICFNVRVYEFLVQLQGCCLLRELGNFWLFPGFFCVVMFIFRTLQMGELDVEIINGSTGMLAYYTMLTFSYLRTISLNTVSHVEFVGLPL